jgi:hypothetical protein
MISDKASNWVDRGEPPEPTVKRILSFYLHLEPAASDADLSEYAGTIRGMTEADATEVHIASYLRTLEERHAVVDHTSRDRRAVAISLWHVVKAAEVRDRALRLIREYAARLKETQPRLSTLIAERLLGGDPEPPG